MYISIMSRSIPAFSLLSLPLFKAHDLMATSLQNPVALCFLLQPLLSFNFRLIFSCHIYNLYTNWILVIECVLS